MNTILKTSAAWHGRPGHDGTIATRRHGRDARAALMFIKTSVAVAALATLSGCGECAKPSAHTAGKPAPIAATVLKLSRAEADAADALPASVRSARTASVAPRIPGTYAEIPVREGDSVKQGDTLARLHAPEWTSRRSAAAAALDLARAEHSRTVRLNLAGAATPAELDAANSRLRGAEAALAEADTHLADTRLTAPFAGVVSRKHADAGDAALPGMPAVTLEDPRALEIEVALPESQSAWAKPGAPLSVELQGVTLRPAITEVTPAADPASRTRTVRARLTPEELAKLPATPAPGEFARVTPATAARGEGAVLAPAEAVMRRGQVESVWVNADGKASLRLVRTGRTAGTSVEILSGLSGHETLLKPAPELTEGAQLR